MKFLAFLMICFFAFSCGRNNTPDTDDNWSLVRRSVYRYTMTKEGYVDSTFQKIYGYKNGVIADSAYHLETTKYTGKLPTSHYWFRKGKNGAWNLKSSMNLTYDNSNHLSTYSEFEGNGLAQFGKITYDTAGRKKEELKIEKATADSTENGSDPGAIELTNNKANSGFDTTNTIYEYNQNGQVSKLLITTKNKEPLRTEINLYTGKDPVSSYVLDEKGDTVQRTTYSKDRMFEKREIQVKDHSITMWVAGHRMYQMIAEDLGTHVKTKDVYKYDQKGVLIEKRIYKAVGNPQK